MRRFCLVLTVCAAGLALGSGQTARAQLFHPGRSCAAPAPCCPEVEAPPTPPPTSPPVMGEPPAPTPAPTSLLPPSDFSPDMGGMGLSTIDSSVGYIDSAIPSNVLRIRFDAAYDSNRPTRAEMFYARGAPIGPGLPRPELKVDYQEITAYAEGKLGPNVSAFIEAPVRFLNPEINSDHAGYGDMNFGFKAALINESDRVTSFQLRTFVPSGDADKGLGNDHVSLEPALLCYRRLSDVFRVEGELRLWVPINGTSFAGDVFRYGIGFSYGERPCDRLWLNPVVELVGWTVLNGEEAVTPPITPPLVIADAAGDTIVNLKLGVRIGLGDRADFYAGYGRALTGEVWYKDILRTELRIAY